MAITLCLLAVLAVLVIASPLKKASPNSPTAIPFTAFASSAHSEIDGVPLRASNGIILLGASTSTSCPVGHLSCPSGKDTAFAMRENQATDMDVLVDGGQAIYVGPTGGLAYTDPGAYMLPNEKYPPMPHGSYSTGFEHSIRTIVSSGLLSSLKHLFYKASKKQQRHMGTWHFRGVKWLACKSTDYPQYEVFAEVPGFNRDLFISCVAFEAKTITYQGFAAYEYN